MIPSNIWNLSEIELKAAFRELTTLESKVLKMRFGLNEFEPKTLQEVGSELGVSPDIVRQTELKAMCKLGWINIIK